MRNLKKSAQSLIEYGLILALVAIIALAVLSKLGKSVTNVGNNTSNTIEDVSSNSGATYCDAAGGTWNASNSYCDME